MKIEREGGAKLPPSALFELKSIHISGNTLFDTATLHALVSDAEGKSVTLTQLEELVQRITQYYRSHGYPLARAIIPAQTIEAGMVRIDIIEARYGKIGVDNRSGAGSLLLNNTLSPLASGQAISEVELNRALLLMSDIPGITINATMKPGESVGTSDLAVIAESGPAYSGSAALDNYGDRFTGRMRAGGTLNFFEPLHHGDVLSVSGLSSGRGMNYGRLVYESLFDGQGTRLGGSVSGLNYKLSGSLAPLNAHGTAWIESLWARHPFVRGTTFNLNGQIQYDHSWLRDRIDTASICNCRHVDDVTASVTGDARDGLLAGGVNSWNVAWMPGRVGYDDATAQAADAATARTQGSFSRWNANFARLQALSQNNALYFTFYGQWANANLDPSRKMVAGGPYSVRAYDIGAISGDQGYQGSVEFRHDLSSTYGLWQVIAFADGARVTVNKTPWVRGTNAATLKGVGAGVNWAGSDHWSARAYVAARTGAIPVLVGSTSSSRAWVEINKGF